MEVRIAGLICMFLGCCLAGAEKERRLKQRWQLLQELCEALRFLEKETVCHRAPLPEALENAAAGCRTALKDMFLLAAEALRKRKGTAIGEIWEQASLVLPARLLKEDESAALLAIAAVIGSADAVMQQTMLESCLRRMEAYSAQAGQDWREKGALYRRLSVAAGAFLLILLA